MTKTFNTADFTTNEQKAIVLLAERCFVGMGGKRPSDLHSDPYTWVETKTLIKNGWSKEAAAGTFSALANKGLISEHEKNEWAFDETAIDFLDAIWTQAQEQATVTTLTAILDLTDIAVNYVAANEAEGNGASLIAVRQQSDLDTLTGPQLVAFFNTVKGPSVAEVKKFANKETATKRLWAALEARREAVEGSRREQARIATSTPEPEVQSQPKPKAARKGTGINLAPRTPVYPCREGSKQAALVDLLSREQGATMPELLEALSGGAKPWQEASVKSGLNWDMNKVKGYGIRTTKRGDEDCYHLVLPAGMEAPLPHTPRKGA